MADEQKNRPPPNWAAEITGMIDQADINELARLKLENATLEQRVAELESELKRLSHEYS